MVGLRSLVEINGVLDVNGVGMVKLLVVVGAGVGGQHKVDGGPPRLAERVPLLPGVPPLPPLPENLTSNRAHFLLDGFFC